MIQGETSTGVYTNVAADSAGKLTVQGTVTATGASEVTQGSTTSGQSGTLVQGAVTTGAPTYTTGKTNPLSLNTAGDLRTVVTSGAVTISSGTVTLSASSVTMLPTIGAVTDCSGTITSGGNAQTMVAVNASRKYLFIQNTSDTTMWINFTTTAVANQPSLQITAGSAFTMEGNFVSSEAVSVIGATTSKAFTCKQG